MKADDASGPTVAAPPGAPASDPLAETAAPSWWDDAAAGGAEPAARIEPPEVSPSNYEILGEHGRGGLGRVLRARDRRTGRIVALKEILRGSAGAVRRFRREALVTANLQHPAIVPVYEVGRWPDGQPFYAMKLVDGVPLATAIRDAADAGARLALLPHVIQVADALGYAHAQGWIHRDLKPGNVLVGAYGETVVIDWGLAKRVREVEPAEAWSDSLASGDGAVTIDGQVLGTPVYMPPEQARGAALDGRADVYAIGALLYHVLAGVPPYHDAAGSAEVIARVTAGPPRPLTALAPGLPPELYTIVARAMAHRADDRYPSARELADDLGRFRAGNLVAAHSYTAGQLVRRWLRRHRAAVAVAVLAVVALATVGVIGLRENVAARRRAEAAGARATAAQRVAEERRAEAEARLGALHTELGLRELAAGSPARALPYLADAYRRTPDAAINGFLLGRALESFVPLELWVAAPGVVGGFSFGAGRATARGTTATAVVALDGHRGVDVAGEYGVLSPDGQVVVARGGDGAMLLAFDAATGAERARHPIGNGEVSMAIDIDAAGHVVVITDADRVVTYDLGLRPIAEAQVPFARSVTAVARSGRVLVGGTHGQLWVWDPARGVIVDERGAGGPAPAIDQLCTAADGATWLTMDAGETRIWRAGAVVARAAHTGRAAGCAMDPGGRRGLTVVEHQPVAGWDLTAAAPAPVSLGVIADAVAISADASLIAVGNAHGTIDLMSATGASRGRFSSHDAPVMALAFAPDGRHLLSATAGGDVRMWRPAATTAVVEIDLGARGRGGAFVGADRAVVFGTAGARLIAAADGQVVAELPADPAAAEVTSAAISGDRARIATSGKSTAAQLWTGAGAAVATLAAHTDRIRQVDFAAAADRLLTASADGTFALWRGRDGALERRIPTGAPLFGGRISPDGHRVATAADGAPVATLWDGDSGQRLADLPVVAQAVDPRFAPDGALVAIANSSPIAPVYDGRTGAPRFHVDHEGPVLALAWSDDGGVLVTGDLAGVVHLTRRDGTRLSSLRVDEPVSAIALRPDGAVVAIATSGGNVRIVEVGAGRELARLATGGTVYQLAFAPGGERLLMGQDGPGVRIWQLGAWTGAADQLDRRVHCAVPYRLDGDALLAATPDPTCP